MWFPPKGDLCTSPPLGWFESNEGGFQKLGRLSRHSNHHLLVVSGGRPAKRGTRAPRTEEQTTPKGRTPRGPTQGTRSCDAVRDAG